MRQSPNKFYFAIVLIILLFVSSCPASAVNFMYPNYDVSGRWAMVANEVYEFEIVLQESEGSLSGTMTRTNGDEPVDQISGTISPNGNIQFTRERPGQWVQVYTGMVSESDGSLVMEGVYSHDGAGQYPWSATQIVSSPVSSIQESLEEHRRLLQEAEDSDVNMDNYRHDGAEATNVPNLTGLWRMVGNYLKFDLSLQQTGSTFIGTLTRTDGNEPVDTVNGNVYPNWTVKFTRERPGSFTQLYTGSVHDINITYIMEGTFSHDGVGSYPWNATMENNVTIEEIDWENIWNVSQIGWLQREGAGGASEGTASTVSGRSNLVIEGVGQQAEAAPGNSREAYLEVHVTHENYTADENPAVTGLQKSAFSIDTLEVPSFGAGVSITRVVEYPRFSGTYRILVAPASFEGTQYTWLVGTYMLRVTVDSGSSVGQKDIPLTIV